MIRSVQNLSVTVLYYIMEVNGFYIWGVQILVIKICCRTPSEALVFLQFYATHNCWCIDQQVVKFLILAEVPFVIDPCVFSCNLFTLLTSPSASFFKPITLGIFFYSRKHGSVLILFLIKFQNLSASWNLLHRKYKLLFSKPQNIANVSTECSVMSTT